MSNATELQSNWATPLYGFMEKSVKNPPKQTRGFSRGSHPTANPVNTIVNVAAESQSLMS